MHQHQYKYYHVQHMCSTEINPLSSAPWKHKPSPTGTNKPKQPSKIHETAPRLNPEGPFNGRPLQAILPPQTSPQHHSISRHEQEQEQEMADIEDTSAVLQGIDTINSLEGLEEDGYLSDEDTSLSYELADAQRQWEESLLQLSKLLNWVLLPLLGKYMGRRMAKTLWSRFIEHFI
ncbi:YLR099W-A-like protein [Saccharomyces cerevisiae x Saccharomyces kudriavzevii VIN7]|uniref:YLR099W-A-like protein n=1 Tax=Saccharomyces cerevisiae x Saccharomyces kudriavzevii (strain VIN7) TaxID=1095631 RepID=H0GY70_SACCK|nr:YLR099W-A-like protein [Saccharomyces cerevisiae x Saccharomyces kudriavzevii VIN7]